MGSRPWQVGEVNRERRFGLNMKGATLEINTEQTIQKAIEAHKAGKLQEAERIYRAILKNQPNHPHANHNLGVIAMSVGKSGLALPLFKLALEGDLSQGQFWLSYVDALIKEKQFNNARKVLEQGKKSGLAEEKIRLLQARIEASSNDLKHSTSENNELSPALALRELGKYQEAEEWLNGFLSSRLGDAEAWSLLSQVNMLNKKDEAAEQALSQAISINPCLPSVYRNQARLLLKKAKSSEALEKAQSGYEESPDDPENWLALAACLSANQRDQEALHLVERALQSRPSYTEAFINRAIIRLRENNINAAIKDAEMAVTLKPHLFHIWELLGTLRYQNKDRSGAIEALKKAHTLEPTNVSVMVDLGELLRQEGKTMEAILVLEEATKIAPKNTKAWTNLGTTFQQTNRIDDAKSAYAKALEINPKLATVLNNLGIISKDAGDWKAAEQYVEQALEVQPDFIEAFNNFGSILNAQGRLEDAEAIYRKAIAINPRIAGIHSNLGGVLQGLGKVKDAEASYRNAIMLDPYLEFAHYNLGIALKELGRLEDAEAIYRKALVLKPDFVEVYNNLGIILHESGRLEEAEKTYRKALMLKPDHAVAFNNLGMTLQELGKLEEAEIAYRKAVALKPDFPEGLYNLGVWLFDTKQYDQAAELLKLFNFKNSQSYLLRCYYFQKKQTKFYELLDCLITQGEANSVIGSLSCRAEIRYGIVKPNSFCSDPFKYVLHTDLSSQYDFPSIFIKPITTILSENKSLERIQNHLTNGRQTFGNVFTLERDLTEEIKKILHYEIDKYRVCFKDSEEGIIKKWPVEYDLYGWLISMKSGGKLRPHMHEKGWISGSVYINVPSKSRTDSGNLVVCIDDEDYLVDGKTSHENIIDVTTGSLCLFPASLLHYTIPFESEDDRIVLAFDVVPK
jgi:tetratricopeptide (TPR) repeat protein